MVRVMSFPRSAAALALASLAACTSEGIYVKVAAQTQAFTHHPGLDPRAVMRASPPACAILPAVAPSTPGLAPLAAHTLDRALHELDVNETVMSAGQAVARMNAAGVATDWQALAPAYVASGVMDRERLAKVGKALGVRHLAMPILATMNSQFDDRLYFFGLTVDRTFWITIDTSLQVWDAETGELEWQSTGTCTAATEVAVATRGTLAGSMITLWKQMVDDMLQRRTESVFRVHLAAPSEVDVGRIEKSAAPAPGVPSAAPGAPGAPAGVPASTAPAAR